MKKLSLYKNIKKLLSSSKPKLDSVHGFQLDRADLSEYLRNFLSKEQASIMLKNINSDGYLSNDTGLLLKQLLENTEYHLYIKSIHDTQVESIFNQGVRCFGETSSIGTINPTTIDEVNLVNTIEKMYEFPVLISRIKGNNGFSQGGIQINGTLILQIPKNASKEEILYFNEDTNTYNIKPSYIIGFLPVDEEKNVKDWILPNDKNEIISLHKK